MMLVLVIDSRVGLVVMMSVVGVSVAVVNLVAMLVR